MTHEPQGAHQDETPLEGWKEIAAYFGRTERTAKLWEKQERLPVHRQQHKLRPSVYAYPSELDAWRAARQPGVTAEPIPLWRRPLPSSSLACLLLLSLITAGDGPKAGSLTAAGITTRHVWSGYAQTPSYDGRFLAYTDWATCDVCVRDLRSGKNRKLTNHDGCRSGEPVWFQFSPDGTQIAYTWWDYKTGLPELRVVSLDGSESRILIPLGEYRWPFSAKDWSHDGKHLLALAGEGEASWLLLVGVADGAVRELRALETGRSRTAIQFSPDGRYIAYDKGREGDIYAFAADGSGETPLVKHPADDSLLGWAPDGSGVLFASNRTGSRAAWFLPVSEGRPEGDPRLVKADLPERFDALGMTQDGAYYFAQDVPTKQAYFATLDPSTGKLTSAPAKAPLELMGDISHTSWSPDGRQMAYIYRGGGLGTLLCVHDFETGQERRFKLDVGVWPNRPLHWSPDGQTLLLVASTESTGSTHYGEFRVYQLDPQTGARSSFLGYARDKCDPGSSPDGRWMDWADWSANGQGIYYVCYAQREGLLMHRDLRTGWDRTVSSFWGVSFAALSPDRQQLAYRRGRMVTVRPVEGGEPRDVHRLESGIRSIGWMPDGQHLIVTTGRLGQNELWWIPLGGGAPSELDIAMEGLGDVHVHPTEPQIVFTAGSDERQVWVMENFLREGRGWE